MQTSSRFQKTGAKSRIKCRCGFHPYGPGLKSQEDSPKAVPAAPYSPSGSAKPYWCRGRGCRLCVGCLVSESIRVSECNGDFSPTDRWLPDCRPFSQKKKLMNMRGLLTQTRPACNSIFSGLRISNHLR